MARRVAASCTAANFSRRGTFGRENVDHERRELLPRAFAFSERFRCVLGEHGAVRVNVFGAGASSAAEFQEDSFLDASGLDCCGISVGRVTLHACRRRLNAHIAR